LNEAYKDSSSLERGIYHAYKLVLHLYTLQNACPYCYGQEKTISSSYTVPTETSETLGMHGERLLMQLLVSI